MKQIKKIARLLCTADFARELIESGKFATLREMYYTAEGWEVGPFHDQSESDAIIEDLEATFGLKRESLGLTQEEDGAAVYGQIVFREGDVTIDATKAGRGGYTIPPTIDDVEFVKCKAKRIIAVETMGMYHRLIQRAWKKFDALIGGLKGQAEYTGCLYLKLEQRGDTVHTVDGWFEIVSGRYLTDSPEVQLSSPGRYGWFPGGMNLPQYEHSWPIFLALDPDGGKVSDHTITKVYAGMMGDVPLEKTVFKLSPDGNTLYITHTLLQKGSSWETVEQLEFLDVIVLVKK